ncbi:MAG TPA: signal peptidase I [Verrucomicrobiae bacterium]|jgi:signal peptidase I|nr:signal peptidase I [Verrucomicrobiae bacterium]
MNNQIAEKQMSIPLVMESAPLEPVRPVRVSGSRLNVSTYTIIRFVQQVGLVCVMAMLSLGSYYLVSKYFVKSVEVVGVSMVPTLGEHNHYLLNLWAFRNRDPQREEIVVIRDPGDHGLSVKRIIATPGESILFKEGQVYVDGKKLDEKYLLPRTHTFTYSQAKEQFITCGKGQYFVLGDNRLRSIDSRSYGPVSREDILGLVKH